jgi:hypothetical protein
MSEKAVKLTSWSFSRWMLYSECPLHAKFKFIDKLPEPQGPALARGTALHLECQKYLTEKRYTLKPELVKIADKLKELKKAKAVPEADFIFKQDWTETRWDDWTGAWCRVKADVTIPPIVDSDEPTVFIDDFKTGKLKDADTEYGLQLDLYALAGLIRFPLAEKAKTSLIFIDHGKTVEGETRTRKDVPKMKKAWELRVKKMLSDTLFKPNPGNACRWCPHSKSKDGQCRY